LSSSTPFLLRLLYTSCKILRWLIVKEIYITDSEREKCRKVANILVVDAGRYGFVKLQYYRPPQSFEDAITFTDSRSMFENLWEEWLDTQLFLLEKGTPMAGMGYNEIFRCLPKEKQEELMNRKAGFAKTAGIE